MAFVDNNSNKEILMCSQVFRVLPAAAVAAVLVACGGGPDVEGTYSPQGDALFDSLSFMQDGQARVELIGITHPGNYEVEGSVVTLIAGDGTRTPFEFDGGCLSHMLVGTYCRSGSAPAASASGGPERYEARVDEGVIELELQPSGRAILTMTPNGGGAADSMSLTITYVTTGDGVDIEMPGEDPLRLTRSGRDLVGTMEGETARFERQ